MPKRKIVINACFGGYSLSEKACKRYEELTGKHIEPYYNVDRDCPYLVQVVEELGEEANGECAELQIEEIPAYVDWRIENYDGLEHIAE